MDFETCQTGLKLANTQENHLLNASGMIHLDPLQSWNDKRQWKWLYLSPRKRTQIFSPPSSKIWDKESKWRLKTQRIVRGKEKKGERWDVGEDDKQLLELPGPGKDLLVRRQLNACLSQSCFVLQLVKFWTALCVCHWWWRSGPRICLLSLGLANLRNSHHTLSFSLLWRTVPD